jgi:PPE-repeat protein
LASLKAVWTGASSERAIAAATPMVVWLHMAAEQAQERAMRAMAQAAAYAQALGTTPSLPEIATNHITHGVLTATNFLGINMMPIGFNETDYFVRMWNQAAVAMDIYQAETLANTAFEPLAPVKPIVQPGVGEVAAEALSGLSTAASVNAPRRLRLLSSAEDGAEEDIPTPDVPLPDVALPSADQISQYLGQMGQLSAPMQQLMQPLQQMMSMGGQGGAGNGLGGDGLGKGLGGAGGHKPGQLGLLGASPLSNHPLLGGAGPSKGLGLMHSEALPGAGGTSARTSMMSQLIEKPAAAPAPAAGAGAGSSAAGGAAPMSPMGQGASSGAGSRPGLAAPATLTADHDAEHAFGEAGHDDDEW